MRLLATRRRQSRNRITRFSLRVDAGVTLTEPGRSLRTTRRRVHLRTVSARIARPKGA
jgi:hypothetical protein